MNSFVVIIIIIIILFYFAMEAKTIKAISLCVECNNEEEN